MHIGKLAHQATSQGSRKMDKQLHIVKLSSNDETFKQ